MKRPLIQVALVYVAGILLARWTVPLSWLFLAAFPLLFAALVWHRARPGLLCAVILLTGWINLAQRTAVLSPRDLRVVIAQPEVLATVRGVLPETPQHHFHRRKDKVTESTTAQIEVTGVAIGRQPWQPASGRMMTLTKGSLPDSFFAGQTVELSGVLAAPDSALAPGLFDYRAYLANLGIYHELKAEAPNAWRILSSPPAPPLADRFCAWARKTLARGLPGEDQPLRLEWALTLGWKQAMTEEVSEPFIRAATYHIFAVDGLRIAIIAAILIAVFRTAGLSRPVSGLLALPLIFFYASMTGWPASAVRAIVMLVVVFLGWCLNRPSDYINSLFAAALAILIWEPRELFQAGFQLSFFVVLCILLIHPFFDRLMKRMLAGDPLRPEELRPRWQQFPRWLARHGLELFLASVAAWLGSIPLVAYYFHLITPLSGPANVVAVPLCALVLIADFLSLLFAWFPIVSELFNHAGWFWMKVIETTSQWSADWPAAYFYLPAPGLFTLGLYYLILLTALTGWLFEGKWKRWKLGAIAVLAAIWLGQWLAERPVTRLTILPLHGGHAISLQAPGWRNQWLINCGNESSIDSVMKPFLRAAGVNRLPNLILTHGETTYAGGAEALVELFRPRNIYTSQIHFRSPAYRLLQRGLTNDPAWKAPLHAGDHAGPWTVLHPDVSDHFPRAEDNALVLRGEINGARVLLLSGLGQLGQQTLLARANDLRADIVVAGPPSDGEPLGTLLLNAINPRVIILADAKDPTPRRTSAALKERLARRGAPVIYTRDSDAVTINIRPGRWEVRAMDGTQVSGAPGTPGR